MSLNGVEVAAKISGKAAERLAVLLYAVLRDQKKTRGKIRLTNMLKSGKELKVFAVKDGELQKFCEEAKKYGVLYCVLKDNKADDGLTDIMVYATDASKVNRVIESFNLMVKEVETIKPEIKTDTGELVKPLGMQFAVPLDLIDGVPDPNDQDKRLLSELQKYAAKMKSNGPQIVEPVGLLCKPNGRYEVLPGQGNKRIMALRLAGYKKAVADISIPKKEGVEVKAENIEERPAQERNESPKTKEDPIPEKEAPTKEEAQAVNPTMARTSRDPASGQNFEKKSRDGTRSESVIDPEKRPSVRKKLEECKEVAAEKEASKALEKMFDKVTQKQNSR